MTSLLGCSPLDYFFEGAQRFIPESIEPLTQRFNATRIDLVEAPGAFGFDYDEPCRLEDLKMLRNG
jgi:hypothetical protein